MPSAGMKPLAGIRVLDMSRVLAGPLCTQMLADLGAEVIKIEPCGVGDESRSWPPYEGDTGTAYLAVNRNKKSVTVDIRRPDGLELVRRLARISDVVVESNSTGASERLGVDHASLVAENPAIIYCSISGYGREGPLKDAKGYDLMLQAFSGILDLTGQPGGASARSPFSPIDQATGHHAVIGIMGALMQRMKTGRGALVEVSLFETAVHFTSYLLQAHWATGAIPTKLGCEHPALVPYQPFATADRDVLIGVANDNLWGKFCRAFGLDSHVGDPRFATNAARVRNRAETVALVADIVRDWTADDLLARLLDIGVPCAPINTIADLAAHPHTKASGIVVGYDHPAFGSLRAVTQPIRFDGETRYAGTAPPALGEHNAAVLSLAGYAPDDAAALIAGGALGSPAHV